MVMPQHKRKLKKSEKQISKLGNQSDIEKTVSLVRQVVNIRKRMDRIFVPPQTKIEIPEFLNI